MSPVQILRAGFDLLLAKDMPGFIALFADDAVMEFPFAPPGQPRRIEGRAAVHDYLIGYPELLDIQTVQDVTVHETIDPATIVVEWTATGSVVASGKLYEVSYIVVLTAGDGVIQLWRDYWNPAVASELLGGGLVQS